MPSALEDIRVLDLTGSVSGGWCSRLLADLGADVVVVEPVAGHPLRAQPPFAADGHSLLADYVLANKRSFQADAADPDHREALTALAARCDVVVEGPSPHALADWGLAWSDLEAQNPDTILVSITPHGLTGARAGRPGNDLTMAATSGWASVNGLADREPLKPSGLIGSFVAGIAAYGAAVTALFARERLGYGQPVDVAESDAMLGLFSPGVLRSEYAGRAWERRPRIDVIGTFPVPVRDGHLSVTFGLGPRLRDALLAFGLQDMADDPRFATAALVAQHRDAFSPPIEAVLRERDRMDWFEELSSLRVIAGPVLTLDEIAENAHLRERGFFVRPDGAEGGPEYPGAPFKMSATPWAMRAAAPVIGAHNEALRIEFLRTRRTRAPRRLAQEPARRPPLEGVRAVVLTHAWLGTFCTEQLGLMGADVIQVEARRRPDAWRGGYEGALLPAVGAVPTARHPWNCSPLFNSVNLNKRAVTLDLGDAEGLALFRRLVADADVVVENYAPRVAHNLGVDYASLRAIRPDLVMLSLSAYGATGPWRDVVGIGGTVEPTSGMSSLLGYAGGPPLNSGQMIPDPIGGWYGFGALVTALRHRERTGDGQWIDLSMQEANLTVIGDAMLETLATGHVRPRMGNRHLTHAPHGIFPCSGTERWIAIAAEDEAQWRTLCDAAGHAEWAEDARFASRAARKANEDALDALIAAWTAGEDRDALAARLIAAGVIAAPVLDGLEVAADATFRERGLIVDVTHREAGTWPQVGVPVHLARTPGAVTRPSPCLGEHSAEVLAEIGVSAEQYAALVARGVSGEGPPE